MYRWWERGSLRDQAGDGQGTGTGAGNGTGDGKPAFDPEEFKTSLLGDLDKKLNGWAKNIKSDVEKLVAKSKPDGQGQGHDGQGTQGDGSGDGHSQGQGQGQGDGQGQKLDPKAKLLEKELAEIRKELANERKAREDEKSARRKAERDQKVQQALNQFQFADKKAAADAFDLISGQVKTTEDGTLTGPDETSFDDFIKLAITERPYLLAPRDVGGAGARGGQQRSTGKRVWTLDDLDSEKFAQLKPEERKEVMAAVTSAVGAAMRGQ